MLTMHKIIELSSHNNSFPAVFCYIVRCVNLLQNVLNDTKTIDLALNVRFLQSWMKDVRKGPNASHLIPDPGVIPCIWNTLHSKSTAQKRWCTQLRKTQIKQMHGGLILLSHVWMFLHYSHTAVKTRKCRLWLWTATSSTSLFPFPSTLSCFTSSAAYGAGITRYKSGKPEEYCGRRRSSLLWCIPQPHGLN